MLILAIGGSGSGKSEYAERLTVHLAGDMPRYYLATMQVWDEECRARIEKHRRQRAGRGFVTVERPLDLMGIQSAALDKGGTILLEDLGNLLQAMISLVDAARRIVKAEIGNIEENRTGFQASPSVPFPFQVLPGCPIKGLHGRHGIVCFFHNSLPIPSCPVVSQSVRDVDNILLYYTLFAVKFVYPFAALYVSKKSIRTMRLR